MTRSRGYSQKPPKDLFLDMPTFLSLRIPSSITHTPHSPTTASPPLHIQQCTDDSNYVGEYQRGKRHGQGIYCFPNGDRYQVRG